MCLGPQRTRQVISFEDRIITYDDTTRPSLTLFEHVKGSKVGQDLFPAYQLPNGKQTFMYYNGGVLLDEVSHCIDEFSYKFVCACVFVCTIAVVGVVVGVVVVWGRACTPPTSY